MVSAETLRMATREAQQHYELPDYLAARIEAIAEKLDQHTSHAELETLLEQIQLYDTYGQTGYLGMGVNHLILEKTIRKVEELLM